MYYPYVRGKPLNKKRKYHEKNATSVVHPNVMALGSALFPVCYLSEP